MYNREMPGSAREPPTEAEIAYVRALVAPFEQALPARPQDRPRRVWPRRPTTCMTAQQLLAEYRQVAPYWRHAAIPISRLQEAVNDHASA
jgi:hypothetical protein